MKLATRLGAALAAMLTLLAPALWNGFPLLQYDTGGYLARWFEGYLVPSRSVVYGLFVAAGWPLDFWPVVVLQAAATVWVLALVLRTHGLGRRPMALLAVVVGLSVTTTLPWIAGILLTDIFAGLAVLALHLVVLRADTLSRVERTSLVASSSPSRARPTAPRFWSWSGSLSRPRSRPGSTAASWRRSRCCGPQARSRCRPPCCSAPITRCPGNWPGRRAATASCSRACCRTAS